MKRLFFDIETSPCIGWFWRPGYKTRLSYNNVIEDAKIICISYKWQDEDKVSTLDWGRKKDDKKLIKEFVKIMNKANEIVGHNGDRFDIPWVRTRALYHGIESVPRWRTLDTLKSVRSNLRLPSNRLTDIGRYFGLGEKIKVDGDLWQNIVFGDASRMNEMIDYCEQDVVLLQQIYEKIVKVVPEKTHVGVVNGGPKWSCPHCGGMTVIRNGTDVTRAGTESQKMQCKSCKKCYRISTKVYSKYLEYRMKNNC
tara:strand:+ start:2618 stop:3376 length:759 start_codon:yes stop_codon:yes gene_type:complete